MSRKRLTSVNSNGQAPQTSGAIVIVGAGNMGGAIARGLAAAGWASRLILVEPGSPSAAVTSIVAQGALHITGASELPARAIDAIILAVKPQIMASVAPAYTEAAKKTLVISVAAGTSVGSLNEWLGAPLAVIRAMPNLPASIGQGITAAFATPSASTIHKSLASALLGAVGEVVWVDEENMLDAVTAVSGSGPAYVFYLAEALALAGEKVGLPRETALALARKTVEGAGALLANSDLSPAELRKSVTSPGGTTEAALKVLASDPGLEKLMGDAVSAATKRAAQLSKS